MPTKKARMTRSDPTTAQIVEHLSAQDTVLEKLSKKLDDAHVMNGGFDSMMTKIEKIETVQEQLGKCQTATSEKVTAIHTAIYDKDEGLYQKVKAAIAWIKTANWVIKGVAVTAATGAAGGFCKLAYDLITGHLLIHYAH